MSNFHYPQKRFLFVHLPKTGGWMIRKHLLAGERVVRSFGPQPKPDVDFSCAIVRNPFDRLVSAWLMFKDGTSNRTSSVGTDKSLQLHDVLDILEDDTIGYENLRDFRECVKHHALQMTHPFNAVDLADTIYRFENFDEAVADICKRLDIPHDPSHIPVMNSTRRHSNWRTYFTSAHIDRAVKIYREDLDRFGYK